jgi:predicted nucleic acid-binding protein
MDRLFIDINVIIDVAAQRHPHVEASQRLLSLIEKKKALGFVSATSLPVIYYLLAKDNNHREAVSFVKDVLLIFSVAKVDRRTLERAIEIGERDFEDGLQIACAEECKAAYLITRNPADFRKSQIPILSPGEYLATFIKE